MLYRTASNPGKRWIKGTQGWEEYSVQSEVIAESMHINNVKKVIEMFLKRKQEKRYKQDCLSTAPGSLQSHSDFCKGIRISDVSKCSAKESVSWIQISSHGSRECHGYSTLGEFLRRVHITNSVWQEGRFHYVMCLIELVVSEKFYCLSGTARKNLFTIIDTLVDRVVDTKESIRQMKKIVYGVMKLMVMYKVSYIGSSHIWFEELEVVRTWIKKLKILQIIPRVDLSITLADMPIEVQRIIVQSLNDHRDLESMSHVNKVFRELCNEPDVWRNMCLHHFTEQQLAECEEVLERRRRKTLLSGSGSYDITWKIKYHFMLRRYELKEEFADPLMLCRKCRILFWQDSGHPCVSGNITSLYEKIPPRKLVSLFQLRNI